MTINDYINKFDDEFKPLGEHDMELLTKLHGLEEYSDNEQAKLYFRLREQHRNYTKHRLFLLQTLTEVLESMRLEEKHKHDDFELIKDEDYEAGYYRDCSWMEAQCYNQAVKELNSKIDKFLGNDH